MCVVRVTSTCHSLAYPRFALTDGHCRVAKHIGRLMTSEANIGSDLDLKNMKEETWRQCVSATDI